MRRQPLVLLTAIVLMLTAAGAWAQDRIGVFFDADGTVTTATTTTPNQAIPVWLLLLEPTQPDVRAWECRVALDSEGPTPLAAWTLAGMANNFVSAPAFFVGLGNPLPAGPAVVLATGTLIVPEAGQEVTLRVAPFSTPSLDDPLAEGHTLMLPVYASGPDLDLFPLAYANGCGLPVCRVNDDGVAGPPLLANAPAGLFFDTEIVSYRIWLRNEGTQPVAGILSLDGLDYEFGLGDLLVPTIFDVRDRPFMVNPGRDLLLEVRQASGTVPGTAGQLVLDPCADPVAIELGEQVTGTGCSVLNAYEGDFEFEDAGVGFALTRELRLRNLDAATVIRLEPSVSGDDFAYTGPAHVYVPPASSIVVPVVFQPTGLGDRWGVFDTGLGACGTIDLHGVGIVEDPNCVVATNLLAFGVVAVGVNVTRTVRVTNESNGTLHCVPEIVDPQDCYFVVAYPITLAPSESRYVPVTCRAPALGSYTAHLVLAPGCPTVELRCAAFPGVTAYTVTPDSLDFGPVDVGTTASRIVTIANTGTLPLVVAPAVTGETVFTTLGQFTATPGATRQMTVYFRPVAARPFQATLELGLPGGETVDLRGEGRAITDRVGLYFDPGYTDTYWSSTVPDERVVAFLVLHAPTAGAGVAGWDLCLDTYYGEARIVDWFLPAGGVVGFGPDPGDLGCARVRYDTPLPWAEDILLATVECLAPVPGSPSWITLAANPLSVVPDQPVYFDGADGTTALPLRMLPGRDHLVQINWSPVPVDLPPPPAALVDGDMVHLSWPCTDRTADGFHVYRQDGTAPAVRITNVPVACVGSAASWQDRPQLAREALLTYTLTSVDGGMESAAGPAVSVRMGATVPGATRLLDNYPNPFNPETHIPFELAEAGRVRLRVFDLAGRLVAEVADEDLPAGRHERTWAGRDLVGRRVPSGSYYARLDTPRSTQMLKMMLLK